MSKKEQALVPVNGDREIVEARPYFEYNETTGDFVVLEKDARKWAARWPSLMTGLGQAEWWFSQYATPNGVAWRQMIRDCLRGKRKAVSTIESEVKHVYAFFKWLMPKYYDFTPWKIRPRDIIKYHEKQLGEGTSKATTVNTSRAIIDFIEGLAEEVDIYTPCTKKLSKADLRFLLEREAKKKDMEDYLNETEVKDLLAYIKTDWKPYKNYYDQVGIGRARSGTYFAHQNKQTRMMMYSLIGLLLVSAARISEIIGDKKYRKDPIRWKHILKEEKTVAGSGFEYFLLVNAKGCAPGERIRQQLGDPRIIDTLRSYWKYAHGRDPEPEDLVFSPIPTASNSFSADRQLNARTVGGHLGRIEAALKKKKKLRPQIHLHCHIFRKTAGGIHYERSNHDIVATSKFMRHSDVSITTKYYVKGRDEAEKIFTGANLIGGETDNDFRE